MEEYLTKLNKTDALSLLKFRSGNHFFPIETGRWDDIEISERQCRLCNMPSEVADEFHYLLKCPHFSEDRQTFIKKYYHQRPSMLKFKQLMTTESLPILRKISKFTRIILSSVKR